MQIADFLIDPESDWRAAAPSRALAFVDLERCAADLTLESLPPFPVIGLGDPDHPLAAKLDTTVEPPVSAESLLQQILRKPRTAAAAVQLLRSLEGLPMARALPLESICYGMLQSSAEHATWLDSRPMPAPQFDPGELLIDRQGDILHLTLDRPQARNAIDRALRDQLFEAFALARLDRDIRSIRLRARGAAFCIGGDLAEFGTTRDPATAHLIRSRTLPALALADDSRRTDILDVHVQGACIGAGIEIAAFAGRLTASSDAWFQLPELSMGLIPGAGGCVSLPRRIGRQRTALMILSGKRVNARTALAWGLVDAISNPIENGLTTYERCPNLNRA